MTNSSRYRFIILIFVSAFANIMIAQNPIITDQFTADPSARVFGEKVYLYPSHDILANEERGRIGWFCMEDYHVFSSDNLTDWIDHGVIVSQYNVPWVNSASYSMWAPDCIYRNGKYYFYFPARAKDAEPRKGFRVGVAVSDEPYGPFKPESEPIKGVFGIDPNVFIDEDKQAYLYWSAGKIFVAKLKENMVELDSEPMLIENLPSEGLIEGPYLFKRNGIYYLTYPHVENETERLEYAVADNPMGPFEVTGVIMDESPSGCWTNHQSIIEYNNQWYIFYHDNDLSPDFDKNRSIKIDSLFFHEDGTIKKVIPSLRGVGVTDASRKIQIDRYSNIRDEGTSVEFLDAMDTFGGWKVILEDENSWVKYNSVDFGAGNFNSVHVKALSSEGGIIQLHLNDVSSPVISEIKIPAGNDWEIINTIVPGLKSGTHNLIVSLKTGSRIEIDWINFN
ncbi:MAG: family 43 glycosylhydrolase [Melioribacteraceae bacterium]|nr:family 43 glycosylhydrolase [Melioribacteraceae bacterium]